MIVTHNIRSRSAYMTFVRGDRSATGTGAGASVLVPTVLRSFGALAQGTGANINVPAGTTWSGIANPYASAVDVTKLIYSTTATVNIALWDPKLGGGYGLGAFQYITKAPADLDFTITPGGGSYGSIGSVMNAIESGQAFFMQGSGTSRIINFREIAKTPKLNDVFFTAGQEQKLQGMLYIKEANNVTTLMDGLQIRFKENYNTAADPDDARKLVNTSENVSVKRGNELMAVEFRDAPGENDTIRLNMGGVRIKNYRWKFNLQNMDAPGLEGFLLDKFTNTSTQLNLNGENMYDFAVSNIAGAYAADRFMIVFNQTVFPDAVTTLSAWRIADKNVQLSWNTKNEIGADHYEAEHSKDARNFTQINTTPAINNAGGNPQYAYTHTAASAGDNYYRIKIVMQNGDVKYTDVVKVAGIASPEMYITVNPNPVENKQIRVQMSGQAAGKYEMTIINNLGQSMYKGTETISSNGIHRAVIHVENISAGMYQLRIISPEKKETIISVSIQ